MPRYLLTDSARTDITAILDYLKARSQDAPTRVRDELRLAMQRLAEFPNIGHLRSDLTDEPLRFWCVYSYLIVYRADPRPIEIIRVFHAAQDVSQALGKQNPSP